MKSSRKKKEMRRLFDVVERDNSGLIEKARRFFGWEKVLNLKPRFYRRYPIRAAAVLVVFLILSFSNRFFFISAESATFYPTTCLGAWNSVGQAQYQPESAASSDVFINESNAAEYPGNSEGIFCGKFLAEDFESPGTLKSAVLTLALQVGDAKLPPGQQGIITVSTTTEETISSSTEGVSSPVENSVSENQAEEVVETVTENESPTPSPVEELPATPSAPASEEIPAPAPEPVAEPTSFLKNWLISPVFAQEAEENSEVVEENSEPEKVVELGPPIMASLEEVTSTEEVVVATTTDVTEPTEGIIASSSEVIVPPPPPDEHFLAVNYSFDGQRWQTLARISEKNWNLFTLSLPVSSWEDLRSLQISVEGIETTAPQPLPKVFLDGMFVGVQYESSLLDDLLNEEDEKVKTAESLRVFPGGDELLIEDARAKIARNFSGDFVLSPQFEGNGYFIFKGKIGPNDQIILFNQASQEIKQLTNNDSLKSEPAMISGYAAWNEVDIHDPDRYGEVFLYDFSDGSVKEITNDRFTDHLPYFEENVLVWEKIDAQAKKHIYQYTLSSGDIVQRDTAVFENTPLPENPEE